MLIVRFKHFTWRRGTNEAYVYINVFAVTAIESHESGSIIFTTGGGDHMVKQTPEKVLEALFEAGRRHRAEQGNALVLPGTGGSVA